MEAFMNQGWFQIAGEIVLMFTALTGAMPDRFVNKIPVLGKLWPIFNWLAGTYLITSIILKGWLHYKK